MDKKDFLGKNLPGLAISLGIIAALILWGLVLGNAEEYMGGRIEREVFRRGEALGKWALAQDEMSLKLFFFVPEDRLSKIGVFRGDLNLSGARVALGTEEARMMRETEGMLALPGDKMEGFYGGTYEISGILRKTGTIADDSHFVSRETLSKMALDGEITISYDEMRVPEFTITLSGLPKEFALSEGSGEGGGAILGSKLAAMLREEGKFSKVGDLLRSGRRVLGILRETNSSLDMVSILVSGEKGGPRNG